MICLDSCFVIDLLKGRPEAVDAAKEHVAESVTTEIVRFEVLYGVLKRKAIDEKEAKAARDLFSTLDVLPFDEGCGERAAHVLAELKKQGRIVEVADCQIAATALENGCSRILTRNEGHFSRIPETEVVTY